MLQTMKIELSEPLQNSLIAFSTALNYCKKILASWQLEIKWAYQSKSPSCWRLSQVQGIISRPYPVQFIYRFWSILVVRHSGTRQTIEFSSFVISGL